MSPPYAAHVYPAPAARLPTAPVIEGGGTFIGVTCSGPALPSPSWPEPLSPQHFSAPSNTAHVCVAPSATLSAPSATCLGSTRDSRVPSPSCPNALSPQHHNARSAAVI